MISNSGHDENSDYQNGIAGDQTGTEWEIIPWYSRPWNCVLRYPDVVVRRKIADLAEKAAMNDHIGYDMYERTTYWQALERVKYDPSKITGNCEADCSAGVIANTKAAGYLLGIPALQTINATYTGNMRQGYQAAGFRVLTDPKYLTSDKYLLRGDILLNDEHHTATNLTDGIEVKQAETEPERSDAGTFSVPLRTWFGSDENGKLYPLLKSLPYAKLESTCEILQTYVYLGEKWAKVKTDGIIGFCRLENII